MGLNLNININGAKKGLATPSLPTGLTLTVLSDTSIKIDCVSVFEWELFRSTTESGTYTLITTVAKGTQTYTNTGLAAATVYWYKVRGKNGSKYSAFTSAVSATTDYYLMLTGTGDFSGVSTLAVEVSSQITFTMLGSARFYTDAGGTANESTTWSPTSGALRTIYLKCPTGNHNVKVSDVTKWVIWGGTGITGWMSSSNAANITFDITYMVNLTLIRLTGNSLLTGVLPTGLTYLYLSTLTTWNYINSLPTGLTFIYMNGSLINWTGLNIGNNGNITALSLLNYRTAKMSSSDMITLLTQMKNRTGTMPASITINDYADYASPPQAVIDAVAALKTAKSITTINLGL